MYLPTLSVFSFYNYLNIIFIFLAFIKLPIQCSFNRLTVNDIDRIKFRSLKQTMFILRMFFNAVMNRSDILRTNIAGCWAFGMWWLLIPIVDMFDYGTEQKFPVFHVMNLISRVNHQWLITVSCHCLYFCLKIYHSLYKYIILNISDLAMEILGLMVSKVGMEKGNLIMGKIPVS